MFTRQVIAALDQAMSHFKAADALANELAPAIHAMGGASASSASMPAPAYSKAVSVGGTYMTETELKVEQLRQTKEDVLKVT